MPIALVAGLAAAMLTATTPATPAKPAAMSDRNDVRCLLVLQALARDPKARDQAARGIFYYMGRLDARGGLARVESMMLAEGRTFTTPQQLQAELGRCGAELTARSQAFQGLMQRLHDLTAPPAAATPSATTPAPATPAPVTPAPK